jgi:hypothetical protein
MFVDANKLGTIQKSSPEPIVVLPSDYSIFMHIDKMRPKPPGSLFGKQFIWKPAAFEHEHYSVDLGASTGNFHEELFIEKVKGKWTDAVKVEDAENGRILFACRDNDFPRALAPSVVAKNNCLPNWVR